MHKATIRRAQREDVPKILEFIHALASYEHLENEVTADEKLLEEWLFDKNRAEVVFACTEDGTEAGFALYFHNFSTFLGKAGIYLEDLFVKPEYRRRGYGKALLSYLAKLTVERGCGRLEWSCLDWNQSAIDFYHAWGAVTMDDWTTFRMSGETLKRMAG